MFDDGRLNVQASLNIVVTAAAGNSGGVGTDSGLGLFGTNDPGTLAGVISVGSIDNTPAYISAFTMNAGSAMNVPYANFSGVPYFTTGGLRLSPSTQPMRPGFTVDAAHTCSP